RPGRVAQEAAAPAAANRPGARGAGAARVTASSGTHATKATGHRSKGGRAAACRRPASTESARAPRLERGRGKPVFVMGYARESARIHVEIHAADPTRRAAGAKKKRGPCQTA